MIKNKFMFLGSIVFSVFSSFGQNQFIGNTRDLNPNTFKDWQTEDLVCKVSKLQTVRFFQTEKFGEPVDIGIDSVSVLFNNDGDYLSKTNYSINEKWYLNCKGQGYKDECSSNYKYYEYFDGSSCLKKERGRKAGSKSYYINYECTNGLKQSATYFFDNNPEEKYIYQYDANGNNIRFELYNIALFILFNKAIAQNPTLKNHVKNNYNNRSSTKNQRNTQKKKSNSYQNSTPARRFNNNSSKEYNKRHRSSM